MANIYSEVWLSNKYISKFILRTITLKLIWLPSVGTVKASTFFAAVYAGTMAYAIRFDATCFLASAK